MSSSSPVITGESSSMAAASSSRSTNLGIGLAPPPASPSRPLLDSARNMPSSPTTFTPASHPGCVLCGLVASAASQSSQSQPDEARTPTSATTAFADAHVEAASMMRRQQGYGVTRIGERDIIYRDKDITVYPAIGKERLCSEGRHLIIVLNQHVESVYRLGPPDITTLSHVLGTAEDILNALPSSSTDTERAKRSKLSVGCVGPIMRDPQIPHAHLHFHAMLGDIDTSLPGAGMWRRNVVFGNMNWWSIEDLRAEIRESTSNNRIKSGYTDRPRAPIERVPDAGSAQGPPTLLAPPYLNDYSSRRSSSSSVPSVQPSIKAPSDDGQPSSSTSTSRGKGRADVDQMDESYEAVDLGSAPSQR